MTHVVTSACVKCKYQDCVAVCPVECFREADEYLVIDPDECIDCAACEPVCPVNAIYAEDQTPADEQSYIAINTDYFNGKDMDALKDATAAAPRNLGG